MVDGIGTLQLNLPTEETPKVTFQRDQDVVIRRQSNRSGPTTTEIQAAKVVSVNGQIATVNVMYPGGVMRPREVSVKDLTPATDELKRRCISFNPQYRQRW